MSKILYIEVSPRKDRSASIEVAQSFLKAYQDENTVNQTETLDLWELKLPEFNGDTINAKYRVMHGEDPNSEEIAAWEAITKYADQFKAADHYLISTPMWNFSIPYKLKPLYRYYQPTRTYMGFFTRRRISRVGNRKVCYINTSTWW